MQPDFYVALSPIERELLSILVSEYRLKIERWLGKIESARDESTPDSKLLSKLRGSFIYYRRKTEVSVLRSLEHKLGGTDAN